MKIDKNKQPRKRPRRRVIRYIYIIGLLVVIAAASGFIMLTSQPDQYKPAPARNDEAVSTFLTRDIAQTWYNNMEAGTPFELIVEQPKLNDLIANESRLGFTWPIELEGATISTPAVAFTPGKVVLMAPIEVGKIPLVISVTSKPVIGKKGMLTLNIESVKAGMVNITPLARGFASKMIKKQLESADLGPEKEWLTDIADAILDNEPIEPVWPSHDDHTVRLTGASVKDTMLILNFRPLD